MLIMHTHFFRRHIKFVVAMVTEITKNVAPLGDLCVAGNDIGLSVISIVRRNQSTESTGGVGCIEAFK